MAANFLIERGYTILARNKHLGHAEVDLIAQNEEDLVFVEVKTRSNIDFGHPEEAVDESKLTHLIEAAERYLAEENLDLDWHIDVIAITGTPNTKQPPDIRWYQNATF